MKKAICTILTILLLMCSACLVLSGCVSQEEMRKNSFKNLDLIDEYFTMFSTYGGCGKQLISGEEILGSYIMSPAAKKRFAADNNKLPRSQRYYDVYLGTHYEDPEDMFSKSTTLIVIVPLARPQEVWSYDRVEGYDYKDCEYRMFGYVPVLATLYYMSDQTTDWQCYGCQECLRATQLDEDGVEVGGLTLTFQPVYENGKIVRYMEVYHIMIDGVAYEATYDMILEHQTEKLPQQ